MAITIENPIINSPFEAPKRQFLFEDGEITNKIVPGRRKSVYFIPIAKPKTKGKAQKQFDFGADQVAEENRLINRLRERVGQWRDGGYLGATQITRRLLDHWKNPSRERRLFFCQVEALETIIYLTEIAPTKDANQGTTLLSDLVEVNRAATPDGHPALNRMAAKMATGSGKTVVMAMLIAWQTLNKNAYRQDKRFTNAFLVVAPGITIRDRLRTLLPSDPENYYQALDLVPRTYRDDLGSAQIVITNYHSFIARDRADAAKLTRTILQGDRTKSPFLETPGQVAERVCKGLDGTREIIVLNDEAHHCYHRKPIEDEGDTAVLTDDEKSEAEQRNADARVWINGLEAIATKRGIKAVCDLSATPFFLAGSGYREGMLFPWVVSDFALIDAIECGIVKIPRVPVEDNTANPEEPVYRNIWAKIGKELPTGTRKKKTDLPPGMLPKQLQAALHSLYSSYCHAYEAYQAQLATGYSPMPPVFIVVCSNTKVSKLAFDWIAGYEKTLEDGSTALVPGNLPVFSNVEQNGPETRWSSRPNSLLIDSQQLESGEALSDDFKHAAAAEISEFKAEIRQRFPGRDADKISPEDLLREVMNTVGKPGKLGERIKCVVSVSMLTEGWDVNTVTHIMGVRAFGTQLLCEQVVGRGLRRMSYEIQRYDIEVDGQQVTFDGFPAEYAEVYGVPFDFLPMAGTDTDPRPPPNSTQVHSVLERQASTGIQFPRVTGYRYELPSEKLGWKFSESTRLTLSTADVPTIVENAPVIGETSIHCMEDLEARRESEVAFLLAKLVLEKYFRVDPSEHAIGGAIEHDVKRWLFPQILAISRRWLTTCVDYKDSAFPQLLLLVQLAHNAADRIYQAIVNGDKATGGSPRLKPLLQPFNTVGDTSGVNYRTTRPTYTPSAKCPLSHVVGDSGWEITVAKALEQMEEVKAYVKNVAALDFAIPYTFESRERLYWPDFIVRIDDGHGEEDLLNLLIEVSGEQKEDKDAKTATVQNLWVPAVNNAKRFGRWDFLEITDPQKTMQAIHDKLGSPPPPATPAFQLSTDHGDGDL